MHASLLWQQQTLPATGPRNFDSMDLDKQKKLASDARCASHSDPSFVHSMRKMRVFAPTASLCITHDQRIGQHVSICEHCQNLATMTKKNKQSTHALTSCTAGCSKALFAKCQTHLRCKTTGHQEYPTARTCHQSVARPSMYIIRRRRKTIPNQIKIRPPGIEPGTI